jgi:hypothetical protein
MKLISDLIVGLLILLLLLTVVGCLTPGFQYNEFHYSEKNNLRWEDVELEIYHTPRRTEQYIFDVEIVNGLVENGFTMAHGRVDGQDVFIGWLGDEPFEEGSIYRVRALFHSMLPEGMLFDVVDIVSVEKSTPKPNLGQGA